MIANVVVATLDESALVDVLPTIHRAGLGHVARVLRPERGPLRAQLTRAGIPTGHALGTIEDAPLLLVIAAAARAPMAASLVLCNAASRCWIVSPDGRWTEHDDAIIVAPAPMTVAAPAERSRFVPGLGDPAAPNTDTSASDS